MTDPVARFAAFYAELGYELEDFQRLIVEEFFSARRELLASLPRGNGKTTLVAALALFELLRDPTSAIYLAAASRDQAAISFECARSMAQSNDFIRSRVTITRRELRCEQGGFLKVISADAGKQLGLIPDLVLVDELCAHPNDELYITLRTAMLKRPSSKLIVTSTAGIVGKGPLADLRERCLSQPEVRRDGVFTRAVGPHVALLEWSLPADWPLERAIEANPARFVAAEGLAEQREAVHEGAFRRFHANQWVHAGEDAYLDLARWDSLAEDGAEVPSDARAAVGMDGSRTFDTTAVAIAAKRPDGMVVVSARVFSARIDAPHHVFHQGRIDMAEVEEHTIDLFTRYDVAEGAYDPRYLERSAEIIDTRLRRDAVYAVEPNSKLMRDALQSFYAVVSEGRLRHSGDPVIRAHVAGAVVDRRLEGDEIRRIRKVDARRPIDAVIAMALAVWRVEHVAAPSEPGFIFL